ncbi:MAG: hypothetical protein DRO87_02645 [Candidatus Thorarchaeota archaeon]|nr:MAG: hypothetical protein DRP09_10060 [Candidatus Thorarchaeota archaeon]RLI59511.1 MAG: hypothetical protein DRO87_02645 [Candidatus Thorarchaeota archaeon]
MAEQFLNRLEKIEASINQLGETLKRMITILGTVTEIKSEVRVAKDEIISVVKESPAQAAPATSGEDNRELARMVVEEVGAIRVFVQESMENLKAEVAQMVANIPAPAPPPAAAPPPEAQPVAAPAAPPPPTPAPMAGAPSSLPADRAMQIAKELEKILGSMKMGCKAGDVLDIMTEAKDEIMRIVPSDPVMVKIDSWVGVVAGYPKRNELQARDILKLKKDIRAEIPKYMPA